MRYATPALVLALLVVAALGSAATTERAEARSRPAAGHAKPRDANHHQRRGQRRIAAQRHAKRVSRSALRSRRRGAIRRGRVSNNVALTERPRQKTASQPSPGVIFRSSFDSGFGGWHVQAIPERVSLARAAAFEGAASARFEVRQGDVEPETGSSRCEVSGPTFDEGDDIYVHDAIRVPSASTYQGSWQIVQQLHETDWGGSPGIAVFLDGDRRLRIAAGDGSPTYWSGPALSADRWYSLTYRVLLSSSPSTGFVEVWLDGVQQTVDGGGTRSFGPTIQTAHTYLKAGIYRSKSSTGTSLVEHDEIAVGTSLASVTP
ncbi:MAG: heparin lyase I family protein [Solirubrobacterales bacterium]